MNKIKADCFWISVGGLYGGYNRGGRVGRNLYFLTMYFLNSFKHIVLFSPVWIEIVQIIVTVQMAFLTVLMQGKNSCFRIKISTQLSCQISIRSMTSILFIKSELLCRVLHAPSVTLNFENKLMKSSTSWKGLKNKIGYEGFIWSWMFSY